MPEHFAASTLKQAYKEKGLKENKKMPPLHRPPKYNYMQTLVANIAKRISYLLSDKEGNDPTWVR